MGIISILLGIITFFCFTGAGAILANVLIEYKTTLAIVVTSLSSISDTSLMVSTVTLFALIGLLIGMNLVMHGLTYNKIIKTLNQIKRKA